MSKDSRPNFRDLYKQKGKNLSSEANESKITSKDKLATGINQLTSKGSISSAIMDRILQLGFVEAETKKIPDKSKSLSFKSDKNEIHMLILHFGVMYQRATATAIPSSMVLYEQFCKYYPNVSHFSAKDLEKTLEFFQKQGLLYQSSPILLFEPLEQSKDINKIFALLQPTDDSLSITTIKSSYPTWTDDKIQSIIEIMTENGLVIADGNILWFPQLTD